MATRQGFHRGAAALLMLAMLLAVFLPAMSALADEKVTATTPLNVRTGPGTDYPIVGELKKGQTVTKVGSTGSWSIILLGGKRLYAHSAYLRPEGEIPTGDKTMYATGRVNVRSGPGTGYKVLTTLDKGDPVQVIGTVGKWTIIKWNNGTAYMFTSLLASKGSGSSDPGGLTPKSGAARATSNVNVRSGPGSSYSKLGMLVRGELVKVTGVIGSWTQVLYRNATAYVFTSYLRMEDDVIPSPVKPASGTVEAITDVNVRRGPGTEYSAIGTLYYRDRAKRTGVAGNWTEIVYEGKTAYVSSAYVRLVTGYDYDKLYITEDTTMRTGPGSSYGRVLSLRYGDTVYLISRGSAWSEVEFGSTRGYVPNSALSESLVKPVSGIAYAPYGAAVYTGPDTSYPRMGGLLEGEGAARTGIAGDWTILKWRGSEGYVRTEDIVALTSAAETRFTDADRWMYGKNGAAVYTVPNDGKSYLYGYFEPDEKVRLYGYNNVWSCIYADGRYLYTRSESLQEDPDTSIMLGDNLRITNASGARMYTDASLKTPFKLGNGSNIIPEGTVVSFRAVRDNAYDIYWKAEDVRVFISTRDATKIK